MMQDNAFKYALSMGLAVSIAVIGSAWFSAGCAGWMMLSAFFIAQMNREAPLRQGLIIVSIILLALLLAAFFRKIFLSADDILLLTGFLFLSVQLKPHWSSILFFIAFVIAGVNYTNDIVDVIVGALIALLCRHFIFPVKWDETFSHELLPVMKALHVYADALRRRLFLADEHCQQQKIQLEYALQAQYPEWVYTVGFNPGLRKGLRYFLVNLERLVEVHFSMQYLAESAINPAYLAELKGTTTTAMQHNLELMGILIHYFEHRQIRDSLFNHTSDIEQLEQDLQAILPAHIDLIEIAPDYILLTELVRDIKDARELLLQLVMTLQGK